MHEAEVAGVAPPSWRSEAGSQPPRTPWSGIAELNDCARRGAGCRGGSLPLLAHCAAATAAAAAITRHARHCRSSAGRASIACILVGVIHPGTCSRFSVEEPRFELAVDISEPFTSSALMKISSVRLTLEQLAVKHKEISQSCRAEIRESIRKPFKQCRLCCYLLTWKSLEETPHNYRERTSSFLEMGISSNAISYRPPEGKIPF
jgi:hypothetical protein